MTRIRTITILVLAIVGLAISIPSASSVSSADQPSSTAPSPELTHDEPTITVSNAAPAQRLAVDEALEMFRAGGLRLPDLNVRFFADKSDCKGHYGLFQHTEPVWTVRICSDVGFVIAHELGHAWIDANLSHDDKLRYAESRGFTNWADSSVAWGDRAVEDAAFIIQQNIAMRPLNTELAIWQEKAAAFTELTGLASPVFDNGRD